jgi:hypothetical protein
MLRDEFGFFFEPSDFGRQESGRDFAHKTECGFCSFRKAVLADEQAYTQGGGGDDHDYGDNGKNCL